MNIIRRKQLSTKIKFAIGALDVYLDNYKSDRFFSKSLAKKLFRVKKYYDILDGTLASPLLRLYCLYWLEYQIKCIIFGHGYPLLDRSLRWVGMEHLREHIKPYFHYLYPICIQRTNYKTNKEDKVEVSLEPVKPSLSNFYGKLYGACLMVRTNTGTYRIIGHVPKDLHRKIRNSLNYDNLVELLNKKDESISWRDYFLTMNIRDHMTMDDNTKSIHIYRNYKKIMTYNEMSIEAIANEFSFCNDYQKYEMINLLLNSNMIEVAISLLSICNKEIVEHLDWCFQVNLPDVIRINSNKINNSKSEPTYETRIQNLDLSDKVKRKAFEKLKVVMGSKGGEGAPKATKWLDNFLSIPWNKLKKEEGLQNNTADIIKEFKEQNSDLDLDDNDNEKVKELNNKIGKERTKHSNYIDRSKKILANAFHGHPQLKKQLIRYLAQIITGGENGMVIGIHGPPGNGKTTAIKKGFAKCIVDDNGKSRPVEFISLSGSSRATKLRGHNYTYLGSTYGRIVSALIDAECMNPILLFDEVDKCSEEIQQILITITDPTQNKEFNDNYFEGIPIDLSKCLIIFTFNDPSRVHPVLLDRVKPMIETKSLTLRDKLAISRTHLIPEIAGFVGMDYKTISIEDRQIVDIINNYTKEAGARQLRQLLIDVIRELNYRTLLNPKTKPIITDKLINDVFEDRLKVCYTMIPEKSKIGQINGMWANSLGLGGILHIQATRINSKDGKLQLTGRQGDTMQESMKCSRTCAIQLAEDYLYENKVRKNIDNASFAVHIPFRGGGVDGPSAGGVICLAIFSVLTGLPINNDVSMTGTCDLHGNLGRIGGLGKKLLGARRAGVKTVVLSKENHDDLELLRKDKLSQEDGIEIIEIDNVREAMPYFFCNM